jgi:hypothetical protein
MFDKESQNKLFEKVLTDTRYFVIYSIIAAVMIGLVAQKCNRDSDYSHILMQYLHKNLEYKKEGRVILKQLDTKNRNMPFIVFSDNEKLDIDENFYEMLQEGDSISKKRSSTLYFIFRNDSVIIYDYLKTSKNQFK